MRLVSLFSGIGGFEKGLDKAGIEYKLVGFSEIDKWAIQSYCAIHGVDERLNLGDVSKIKNEDLPRKVDIVTYGFPCQDISVAGKQEGIKDGTRSGLLYEAERVIQETKPKYAVAENVKNLVGKRHKEDFDKLLERLDGYGYNNYWKVLNSKDYGIPQNRERVFIVSVRKDVDEKNFKFPKKITLNTKLMDLLEENPDDKYYISKERKDYNNYDKNKVDKAITKINPIQIGSSSQFGNSVNNSKCAYTIRATNPNGILDENYKIRKLTPLECWRLMGFEDEDYWKARRRLEDTFYNGNDRSNSQMYKQAGNSIVVDVVEAIFRNLLEKC